MRTDKQASDLVQRIKALWIRHAPLQELTPVEQRLVRAEWATIQASEEADRSELDAALRLLTIPQARELAHFARARYDSQEPEPQNAQSWLGQLATFVDDALLDVHPHLLAQNILWPPLIYRQALPATRDALMQRLHDWTPPVASPDDPQRSPAASRVGDYLLCLAWIGDDTVQAAFAAWEQQPPGWRNYLDVGPALYAHEAGWELLPDGKRHDLFYGTSFMLELATLASATSPIVTAEPLAALCGYCQLHLHVLFDLPLSDPRLAFLGIAGGERLRIPICERCHWYGPTTFYDVDWFGQVRWSLANTETGVDVDGELLPLGAVRMTLGERRQTPFETAFAPASVSTAQVGGHPNWAQAAYYPVCPQCQQTLIVIAQIDTLYLIEHAEGISHAFLCIPCHLVATHYAQT